LEGAKLIKPRLLEKDFAKVFHFSQLFIIFML
jgi:hypothetical protein